MGTDDFLYGNARDYMEFLDKKGIRSVKEFTSDKFGIGKIYENINKWWS